MIKTSKEEFRTGKGRLVRKTAACTLAAMLMVSATPMLPAGNIFASTANTFTFSNNGVTVSSTGSGYEISGSVLTIKEGGQYIITGNCDDGSIAVNNGVSDVILVLDSLDLTTSTSGKAPIIVGKSSSVTIQTKSGTVSTLTDNESGEGAAIKAKSGSSVTLSGNGTLNINGTTKNGLKGASESSVTFTSGTYKVSAAKNGIAADGSVTISGGSYDIDTAAGDGIKADPDSDDTASAGTVNISGGSFDIDAQGDGIQAVTVNISGGNLDIETSYANAGVNYYNKSLGSGNYNTLTTSGDTTKTETVNVDTGSHKGIKAGIKAKTYSYKSVTTTGLTAGTKYTQAAKGGLNITGGTIDIDTTATGIKYNSGGGGMNGGTSGSGNTTVVDGKVILGAADDGIKSNNTCNISGGAITIKSADDGIGVAKTLNITGSANIDVQQAYEGIEAGTIIVGSGKDDPAVKVYSFDDGINTASKTYTYVYANEDEEQYTKTTVSSSSGNDMTVNSGNVTVTVGDDSNHSYSIGGASGTFSADGDGIDCNGSFYAKGGKTVVWGPLGGGNSPIDTADNSGAYVISKGAEVLAAGSTSNMVNNPTSLGQAAAVFTGTVTKNNTLAIKNGSSVLFSAAAPKAISYLMYSSPSLTSGSSYTLYNGNSSVGTATASTTISGGNAMQGGPGSFSQNAQTGPQGQNDQQAGNQQNGRQDPASNGQTGNQDGQQNGQTGGINEQPGQMAQVEQENDTAGSSAESSTESSTSGGSTSTSTAAITKGTVATNAGQTYKVTAAAGSSAGTVTFIAAKNVKTVTVPKTVTLEDGNTYKVTAVAARAFTGSKIRTVNLGANIKTISANAFAGGKVTKVVVSTKNLTKSSVKGSLKSSKVSTVKVKAGSASVNRTYVKKYKKIFTKANAGKKVTVK